MCPLPPLLPTPGLSSQHTVAGWRSVFCVAAGISAIGALIFTLFGSGKIQKWALPEEEKDIVEADAGRLVST